MPEPGARTVRAVETCRHHDLLVLHGDEAQRYSGIGSAAGAELALALADTDQGESGHVESVLGLGLPADNGAPEGTPASTESALGARIFDSQVGRIWTQLSLAVISLRNNQRGAPTIAAQIDGDDIFVRSRSMWKAFGFILDREQRQLWGWRRTTYVIRHLPLELRAVHGRLSVIYDDTEVSEDGLVGRLERLLWP